MLFSKVQQLGTRPGVVGIALKALLAASRIAFNVTGRGLFQGRRVYNVKDEEYAGQAEHADMHFSGALYSNFLPFYQRLYSFGYHLGRLLSRAKRRSKLNSIDGI